jgi:hypothetical protein
MGDERRTQNFYPENQNVEARNVKCAWEYSAEIGSN